jgi:hypothetical protein
MLQTMFEKLQLHEEKNLLIQGLPSSIEKQFTKLSFAKNVTPLLRSRKIDFALVFAVNQNQLNSIMQDVIPALHEEGKLWIAYPKAASKIVSDLNRECSWKCIRNKGFESIHETCLDHVWSAIRFQRQGLPLRGLPVVEMDADCLEEADVISAIPVSKVSRAFGKIASRI